MESTNGSKRCLPLFFQHSSTSSVESDHTTFHQRCSSESFLLEEQPCWLDDLLNDSDSPAVIRGHHRSASDTYADLGQALEKFNTRDQSKYLQDAYITSAVTNMPSLEKTNKEESETVISNSAEEHIREESSPQNLEGSNDTAHKPSAPKIDSKRTKQNTGHRSTVRKLQYIDHLERTVQFLQAEGCEVSAEIGFLEQQNTLLNMENKALRESVESLSQELLIKHLEQEMLRREMRRMQTLFQLQQAQHQQNSRQHGNKSRDLKTNQLVSH